MATRAPTPAQPLDALLAAIPSLPRPVLSRLTARLVDRLDEMDGDPDLEPEEDLAADDEGEGSMWTEGNWHFGPVIGGRQ